MKKWLIGHVFFVEKCTKNVYFMEVYGNIGLGQTQNSRKIVTQSYRSSVQKNHDG